MEQAHHTISYVELRADDLDASRAFYESAFGWTFNDYGPAYAGIRSADGSTEVGGLNATGQGTAAPLVLLVSEDLEASLAAVEAAGGGVVTPIEAYPGGRRFTFADPGGTVLGVFQTA
jgi:predicted enzyme related to lactoylglutathione lyase